MIRFLLSIEGIIGIVVSIVAVIIVAFILLYIFVFSKRIRNKKIRDLELKYSYFHGVMIGECSQILKRLEIISHSNLLYSEIYSKNVKKSLEIPISSPPIRPYPQAGMPPARPIDTPPYYGYCLRPGITFSYLSLAINERAQVLKENDTPFNNIFAAGEITSGNVLGQGYMAGFGMTIGTVFGRIAGKEAVCLK